MSILLNTNDFQDQSISEILMKNRITNEAPTTFKKDKKFIENDDIKKYINRCKKKKCTILPFNLSLSSTAQSTITTLNSLSKKDDSKLNKFLKNLSINKTLKRSNSRKTVGKLKKPRSDDMKFLYNIFFDYEENESSLSVIKERSEKNTKDTKKTEGKYDLNKLRNYLIKNQKEYNEGADIIVIKKEKMMEFYDYYIMNKLEDLIARYSFVIFLFVKADNALEAKNIFLLMIKENMRYFNYIEDKILYQFTVYKDKNVFKDTNQMNYQLIKIYSFIIRYSQLFNTMKYRNKFMGRYYRIINLNYHYFLNFSNFHGLTYETKDQIKYWLSFYLSYVNYFSISNYSSLSLPISLNSVILSLYKNSDENFLTKLEKKLIINTTYNQGLLLYIIDKKEEALFSLKKAEINIKIMDGRRRTTKKDIQTTNRKDKLFSNTNLTKISSFDINEMNESRKHSNNRIFIPARLKKNLAEQNGHISEKKIFLMKSLKHRKVSIANILYEDIENIFKNFAFAKVGISDIKLLMEYGLEVGKLSFNEVYELEKSFTLKFHKSESTGSPHMRNSQLIRSSNRLAEIDYPVSLTDPLLIKIELLIGEIEINKKNLNKAYEYALKTFFLLILLKITKINEYQNEYIKLKKTLNAYLKKIDTLCDEKLLESSNNDSDEINSKGGTVINLNYSDNFEEKKRSTNDETIMKEFEKFFIFLNTLSLYQFKILNETQPENIIRNDLPILFSSQFKDCLSNIQRLQLSGLQTLALNRFTILKNPNGWILPCNLNTDLLNPNKQSVNESSCSNINYLNNLKGMKFFSFQNRKRENISYKKILSSKKINNETQEFLHKYIELVMKVLRYSSDKEIQYMICYPSLLVHSIKKYLKKMEKKYKANGKELDNILLAKNINNGNDSVSRYEFRKSTCPDRFNFKNRFSNANFMYQKKKFTIYKKVNDNKGRRRNKSTGNIFLNQNIINGLNQNSFLNDAKGTKDYNDSYEDFKLSIDSYYDD